MPTEVIQTIGAGGDFATPNNWDAATRGLDNVGNDEVRIGEIIQSTPINLGGLFFPRNVAFGGTSDATRFRWLRPAAGNGYNPRSNFGAQIQRANSCCRIQERFFRMGACGSGRGRIGVFVLANGLTGNQRCIRVDRDAWIDAIHAKHFGGQNVVNSCFQGAIGIVGNAVFTNCVAQGANNTTTTVATGARFGYRDLSGASGACHFLNCVAYQVKQSVLGLPLPAPSFGTGFQLNADTRAVNCAAFECGYDTTPDECFHQNATPTEFSNCISDDSSATGADSFTGELFADTLSPGFLIYEDGFSKAINNGADVSSLWPFGLTPQDYLGDDHDADGFGWEIGIDNLDTSVSPTPAVATAVAPEVGLLLEVHPDSALATAVAPSVGLLIAANPDPGVAIAVAPVITAPVTVNPDPGVAIAVAPVVEGLLSVALPRVCFELQISRVAALRLLVSRRPRTSARVERVLEQSLRIARAHRVRRSILQRTRLGGTR